MGTDVTFLVERRDAGAWRHVEPPLVVLAAGPNAGMSRCARCRGAGMIEGSRFIHVENDAPACPGEWPGPRLGHAEREPWYARRDETLFALLKPGRPRIAFLDEEHYRDEPPLQPIAAPRGLPDDASRGVRDHVEGMGDWGLGWLLLAELLRFDWSQPVFHAAWAPRGVAPPPPDPSVLVEPELRCPPGHVRVTWTQPLWQHVHPTFFATILKLTRLADGRVDDVRCTFYFTG